MIQHHKEIYLIRHGETDFNKQRIIQGRGVNTTLNEKGIKQARAFYEHFSSVGFEIIFTSNLTRTQQTVIPFVEAGHVIQPHEDLDEINWGIYEGKLADTGMSKEYVDMTGKWKAGNLSERIPGGESPLELQTRQIRFIENHLKKVSAQKILICCHGRAMRSLLCTLTDIDLSKMDDFPHQNLSLYKLNYKNDVFEIDLFNYTEHLNGG